MNTKKILIATIFVVLLVWSLFPIYVAVSTSLKKLKEVFTSPATFIPSEIVLSNYIDIWRKYQRPEEVTEEMPALRRQPHRPLARPFLNSIIVSIGAAVVNMALGIPAAYALARFYFRGKKTVLTLILASQMFAPPVFIVPLFRVIRSLGMLNTYQGLILVNVAFTLAFSIWILEGFFETIPKEVEESALIDGASRLTALFRIILPMAIPGIVVATVYTFILTWGEFLFALTLTSSEAMKLVTVHLVGITGVLVPEWNMIMAAVVVCCLPSIILFTAFGTLIKKGVTAGAIKG